MVHLTVSTCGLLCCSRSSSQTHTKHTQNTVKFGHSTASQKWSSVVYCWRCHSIIYPCLDLANPHTHNTQRTVILSFSTLSSVVRCAESISNRVSNIYVFVGCIYNINIYTIWLGVCECVRLWYNATAILALDYVWKYRMAG